MSANNGKATSGQMQEFISLVVRLLPLKGWDKERFQQHIKKPRLLKVKLEEVFALQQVEQNKVIAPELLFKEREALDKMIYQNELFYKQVYNTKLIIPQKLFLPHKLQRNIFDFPMIINKGLCYDYLWQEVLPARYDLHMGPNGSNSDMKKDIQLDLERRNPNLQGSYLTYQRNTKEADEENRNISADLSLLMGIDGQTLLERMHQQLYRDWLISQDKGGFFDEQGKIVKLVNDAKGNTEGMLDVHKCTLCTGSRFTDGSIPLCQSSVDQSFVGQSSRTAVDFRVSWDPDGCYDSMRPRSVVSY